MFQTIQAKNNLPAPTIYFVKMRCGHTVKHDLKELDIAQRSAHAERLAREVNCDYCNAGASRKLLQERLYQNAVSNQIKLNIACIGGNGEDHMQATIIRDRILFEAKKYYDYALDSKEFRERFSFPASQYDNPEFWIRNAQVKPQQLDELLLAAKNDSTATIKYPEGFFF